MMILNLELTVPRGDVRVSGDIIIAHGLDLEHREKVFT
jgi:hypothetical protein